MPRTYPSPTLVAGVGRFGLATLERLGADWMGLRLAGGGSDPSLRNLRLLWVRPEPEVDEEAWRRPERKAAALALATGEGDLPSLALDLAVLRTLGLVRYRDGSYQVAVPRDSGVVEVGEGRQRVRRRRWFEWWSLSPDPIAAVERLRRLAERHNELDLFTTPILNRLRQGHSPRLLIAVIGRCRALAQGRDPSPWPLDEESNDNEELDGFAPDPLPGWRDGAAPVAPAPFVPGPADIRSPFDARRLLAVDWENSGWASESDGHVRFEPVPASPFRLGLFDHDAAERPERIDGLLESRLRELAEHVRRGLLRLWVDLQRDRVEELDPNLEHRQGQEEMDTALRQSLEVLGELLVRHLVDGEEAPSPVRPPEPPEDTELPGEPSPFLSGLFLDEDDDGTGALEERLAELGLGASDLRSAEPVPVMRTVALTPLTGEEGEGRPGGLLDLRKVLNEEARRLYDFTFLSEYRADHPTRRPPRLTVYVVADMGEPFARATVREILREIHAELMRALSPIFELYHEGFNRCLSVVPILWMPHPADPYAGAAPAATRCEEAAIIDAVHGVRRWVESVLPASRRRVSQIFVNGRVTDNSVLRQSDAVRQTRDFLSLLSRNEPGRDEWLRRASTGPGGDDLFSSFACYEIDFPAERCREYLANRLAREALGRLRRGWQAALPSRLDPGEVLPPEPRALMEEGRAELERLTAEAGAGMAGQVTGRLGVDRETTAREILDAFDTGFERTLQKGIHERWSELTRGRGRVDDVVDRLRRDTSALLPMALSLVQAHGDRLIEEDAGHGGLPAAQEGFERLRAETRDGLLERETERRHCEDLCRRHRIPEVEPVRSARRAVVAAAERKPDLRPLQLGFALVLAMSPVLGAPLSEIVAYLRDPGWLATAFGRFDWLIGGAAVAALAGWLLLRHLDRRVRAVRAAIESLALAVRRLFTGTGEPPEREDRASVRSFFESRLRLTSALATRGYALRVHERAVADAGLGHRLARSLEVQHHALTQNAEDLGVRPAGEGLDRDDLRGLFAGPDESLIDPARLHEYFERRVGSGEGIVQLIPDLLRAAGGLSGWRREACLTDRETLLRFGRERFEGVVGQPIAEQDLFADEAGERLCRFVARCYPNLGFGAKFLGYEGLDPDGVHVSAAASLVAAPALERVYQAARSRPGAAPTTDTMGVVKAQVRPNAAWMVSLVQGIRAHSVRNLRRFESFHDRVHMPDDRTFPLAQEEELGPAPLNHLSGYSGLGPRLRKSFAEDEHG
ncbi:MAG TPA: hypothetical protein VH394_15950 [Thermoanaerobaculia bacterium]|nr:hypothetical protein [Thermoanaerobaculia bacterium]